MKTFNEYWNSIPTEIKESYCASEIVAASMAWDAAMFYVLQQIESVIDA